MIFPVVSVHSNANGDSHYVVLAIPLNDRGLIGRLSKLLPAKVVIFREL